MRERKKKASFYAKASDVKSAFYTNHPILVLLYKDVCFNTNELDESLPSVVVSLLQEYEVVFPNDVLCGLPPCRHCICTPYDSSFRSPMLSNSKT